MTSDDIIKSSRTSIVILIWFTPPPSPCEGLFVLSGSGYILVLSVLYISQRVRCTFSEGHSRGDNSQDRPGKYIRLTVALVRTESWCYPLGPDSGLAEDLTRGQWAHTVDAQAPIHSGVCALTFVFILSSIYSSLALCTCLHALKTCNKTPSTSDLL